MVRKCLSPFLEEADPLAATVRAPEVAAAARAEAAVVRPVVADPVATHARPPEHRDPRGTSISRLGKSREDLSTSNQTPRHPLFFSFLSGSFCFFLKYS